MCEYVCAGVYLISPGKKMPGCSLALHSSRVEEYSGCADIAVWGTRPATIKVFNLFGPRQIV